ncbi:MAG: (d)CMP kinase [Betaproteobacteria bacterium]|nr:(d)CMP kinase [Betaproteobacteria bacterium]
MVNSSKIPVIAIDGPSASGKGTVARLVAQRLGFHFLDSGALYRLVTLAAIKAGIELDEEAALARLVATLDVRFENDDVFSNQELVTDAIRAEQIGVGASQMAALPAVRTALLARQRAFRQPPGLVADGRDMGSVVFPDAALKIYLTADVEERARRRHKQLIEKGMDDNMTTLLQDIRARDERDRARAVAPLQKSDDASVLDTTRLTIDAAVEQVLARYAVAKRVP